MLHKVGLRLKATCTELFRSVSKPRLSYFNNNEQALKRQVYLINLPLNSSKRFVDSFLGNYQTNNYLYETRNFSVKILYFATCI